MVCVWWGEGGAATTKAPGASGGRGAKGSYSGWGEDRPTCKDQAALNPTPYTMMHIYREGLRRSGLVVGREGLRGISSEV